MSESKLKSMVYFLSNFFTTILIFTCTLVYFCSNFPIINQIEISKDYTSKLIQSILIAQPVSFISSVPLLMIDPLVSFKRSHCVSISRNLLENTIIDSTQLSFSFVDSTYESLLKSSVKKGEHCPTDYKQCGTLDTLDNIMCVKGNTPCPINLIVIDEKEEAQSEYKDKYTFTNVKFIIQMKQLIIIY